MSERTPPPTLLPFIRAGIAGELAARPQWVAWALEWVEPKDDKPGRWTKVPKRARDGENASTTNPADWATIEQTIVAVDTHGFDGIGFVFDAMDDYFGIDSDDAYDPATGKLTDTGRAHLARFPGCLAEKSVSGRGLHLIGKATAFPHDGSGNKRGATECYWHSRFFAMSGQRLPARDTIADQTDQLLAWHPETFGSPKPPPEPVEMPELNRDDREIIERVVRMPKGRALLAGDISGYPSASEADTGFLNCCVRAGATLPDQLDRLYRASGIYRDKWERADYRKRTIDFALNGYVQPEAEPTTPNRGSRGPNTQDATSVGGDAGDELPDDPAALKRLIAQMGRQLAALDQRVAFLETENARLLVHNQRLSMLQSKTMMAMRSKNLGTERLTGIAIALDLANKMAASPEQTEFVVPYKRIANQAGLSASTVGTHVRERLDHLGLWKRRPQFVPKHVDEDGVIHDAQTQSVFEPAIDPLAMLDVIATAAPVTGKPKNNHGGRADRGSLSCRHHPDAGVIKRVSYHCAECDALLDQDDDEPVQPAERPKSQDATSVGDRAESPAHIPPVAPVYRTPNGQTCHNERVEQARADIAKRVPERPTRTLHVGGVPYEMSVPEASPPRCIQCERPPSPGSRYCRQHGGRVPSPPPAEPMQASLIGGD